MTETLYNFINNTLKLPYKIYNIEKAFSNGFLFGKLLENSGHFNGKISKYNENPKNISEIKENFKFLQKDLHLLEIYLNNSTINDLISEKEGVAPKLLYKIKTEIDRLKINFSNIVQQINENSYREKFELGKKNNISGLDKTRYLELTQSNKFSMSHTVTTRETLSTFNNFFLKPKNKNDIHNHILLSDDNKINLDDTNPYFKNKIKLKPIKINNDKKEKGKMFKSSKTSVGFRPIEKPKNIYNGEDIMEKINDEEENINNYFLSTPETNISNKIIGKNKSKSLYNKKNERISINASNIRNYIINSGKYIKYSIFDNNTKFLGLNINEIAPKLKKSGINYNNDYYLTSNQILNTFKNILSYKKEENKNKVGKLNTSDNKNYLLISQEKLLKNSIINQHNDEDKLFSLKFKKNSTQYKMHEYDRLISSQNKYNNKYDNKLYKKFYLMENSYSKPQDESKSKFYDVDEYINNINKENIAESIHKNNLKKMQNLKDYQIIKGVTNLIIDFVEECYKSQIKLEEELIEIPEYREWNKFFIEGKSCLKIPIKKRRDKSDISKNEKDKDKDKDKDSGIGTNNSSMLTKFTKKSEKKKEKKNIVNNTELILMEYNDYLYYRGNWEISNFVDKNLYGKYLHIYNILEDDIFKIIPSAKNLFQGFKPAVLLEKSNNEFELKEEELINILVPKSNVRNSLLGEIIFLNFDNSSSGVLNNNITNNLSNNQNNNEIKITSNNNNTNNNTIEEKKNENIEEESNINIRKESISYNLNNFDFDCSYIPLKICLIGHSFSGRRTQAKLLCEKYPNLKSYSINDITQFYLDEYNRLHTPIEKNPKFKTLKKNQITQMKEQMEEEIKKYNDIFILIEKYYNKNKEDDLNIDIDKISDDLKINLLIYQIKKDFPKKNENEINEQIQTRIQAKQKLEEEINKLKEEMENETLNNSNNNKDSKENKKSKNKPKKNNNANNIKNLTDELEKIINDSFEGFILYDYPNTYNQYLKLENIATGYMQAIDQDPDKRDIYMSLLTNTIDKPYINISNLNKEANQYLNPKNQDKKSFFNCYILLELSEEETLKRMNNRLKDPNTGIIYHKEYSPPNPADKKLNDRLVEITEPNNETIKELLSQFYLEYPNILYFIHLFGNFHRIDIENKEEIFKKIEEIILGEIKKYEEREDKDIMGNLMNQNFEINDENEVIKYFTRLTETKKVISKEISEDIIKNWHEEQDVYIKGVRNFIKDFEDIKTNILDQMNIYQEEFIDFLNSSSKKYKLIDIFYKKYNTLLEKFPYIKNSHLGQEEFDKNINELIDHLWEMIQMRKRDSISELNNIKNQNFIESQMGVFGSIIINLFLLETNQYYNKINLIKKFYFEFEKPKVTEKFPYEYKFNEDIIIEGINEHPIFISDLNPNSKIPISPKIDKLYKNCYKLFFIYDHEMDSIRKKYKDEYNLNSSTVSIRPKRKLKSLKKKNTMKSEISFASETKNCINYEEEMKAALSNEKIKYKIRILFLKYFAEKNLKEIYDIGQAVFNCLDNHIIESVNSQNIAMNELILKIRKNINEGVYKLNIKDVELDLFDIFEKSTANFTQFNLNYLYSIPEEEKKINYIDLYMIYLDSKNFEIQKNYASVNTIVDIVFKKHLFEYKSQGFMKYMRKIPYSHIHNFINKYIIKKDKGYSVIKLNELFTSLALLNIVPPRNEQQSSMMKSINDKLKYKKYLTKNDFMNCKMWFEKEDNLENNNNINVEEFHLLQNFRSSAISLIKNTVISEFSPNKRNKRGSGLFQPSNKNQSLIKEIPEERKLKEFLFNVNKNDDELIDFMDLMKRINIKKNVKRKKSTRFIGASDMKSNLDKAEILSQNSFMESVDKTQMSESTTNYFKGSKNLLATNNLSSIATNLKEENKIKSQKSQKLNDTLRDFSEEKLNNNINEIINFPEYTYFDYLIKKA